MKRFLKSRLFRVALAALIALALTPLLRRHVFGLAPKRLPMQRPAAVGAEAVDGR